MQSASDPRTSPPAPLDVDWDNQYRQWTKDITGLMAVVLAIAALVILTGILAGYFTFLETLPIFVMLALILPVWLAARKFGWRWTRYFPALLCFGLGVYSSSFGGYQTIFVLFYALAVLLAGMLVSNWLSIAVMIASIFSYGGLGTLANGFSLDVLPYLITFSFGLVAVTLLQSYTLTHLRRVLEAQSANNRSLQEEIHRRITAEHTQRDQEVQLRRLAEHTTDLVAEIDANGQMLYASPSYQTVLGFVPEALLGTNSFDLVHPDDIGFVREKAIQSAVAHAASQAQMRVRCRGGEYIYMDVSGNPLYDQQDRLSGYVLSSRDIHLQKQAEEAQRQSERKFHNIILALPLGVHMYTLEEGERLVFSGFNPAAAALLGIDHAGLVGRAIEEAFPGLAGTDIAARYRDIARQGGFWDREYVPYAYHEIQGIFELHAFQDMPNRMVVVFNDITRRIQAAEALRLSEEKFSTAFHTSPDSININRLSDGIFLDVNQGFTRLTGFTREEVIGKSSLELNIWADPCDRDRLVHSLKGNGFAENLEATFRRKDGSVGNGLMSAKVITIQGETRLLSVTRDVTDRIQAEITLRANDAQIREAHSRLTRAYDATLLGWARALELRERETADHSRRVVEQTVQVARALGIDGDELVHLQRGALLHDIGKLGVPDQILLKPGPLTDEEWVVMRRHPDFARAMLGGIDYLRQAMAIPYSHHEHWDGSGYPQGLKGEEIPLAARIFAIVDVFDALTHARPYRPAWLIEDAIHYLIAQSGRHFDPKIVEVFLNCRLSGES